MAGLGTGYRNEPQPPHVGRRIAALAARQHGVVSAAQLRALGLGRSWMQRRLSAASLHPLHRGVYAVGHPPLSVRGKYMAAVLACGTGAVLSHRSAGALWGLWSGSAPISVTVPRGRTGPPALDVHQSRLLEPVDVARLDAIPVTGVARTLLDLAAVLAPRGLARALDRSERLGLFDLAAVESTLARARGRRGAAALRHAIAAWRPRDTRSELEDRHHELLREADLPLPRLNVLVEGERGIHEVDAFWPAPGLVVQLDGFAYQRTRRDRARDAAAGADLELAGQRVVRLTWDESRSIGRAPLGGCDGCSHRTRD